MSKSIAQLLSEVAANLPDNTTAQITPAVVRTTLDDIINSYFNVIDDPAPQGATGPPGPTGPTGPTGPAGGGGGSSVGTLATFGNVGEAMAGVIPDSITTVEVSGFLNPSDGGGGYFKRVNSIPTFYSGTGLPVPAVPPGFASGVPNLCFATGVINYGTRLMVTTQPIVAGSLTVLVVYEIFGALPTTITDSAGNVYSRAVHAAGGINGYEQAIYYHTNPVYAPPGTSFESIRGIATAVDVYCIPGFTGAVLDVTASQVNASSSGGVSLTSPALTGPNDIVFGFVYAGGNPGTSISAPAYVKPAGWSSIDPSLLVGSNPICAIVAPSGTVTFNPTWTAAPLATVVLIAAFKTSNPYRSSLNPSLWQFQPEWPLHVAQYGILPGVVDNEYAYQNFGIWAASIAPPSDTSAIVYGVAPPGGAVTIVSGDFDPVTGFITLTLSQAVTSFIANEFCILDLLIGTGPDLAALDGTWKAGVVSGTSVALFGPVLSPPGPSTHTTITGGNLILSGCTLSIGNPCVVTIAQPRFTQVGTPPFPHGKQAGQMISFSTTGTLPAPLVPGQKYFIQYGTVEPNSFSLSAVNYINLAGNRVVTKGPTISTLGGTQSGIHTYTTYGEDWAEIVFDPGLYYSNNNQFVTGYGLRKQRFLGYGARLQTLILMGGGSGFDINSPLYNQIPFSTQFATTDALNGSFARTIPLIGDPHQADNFDVNDWVQLSCNEVFGSDAINWSTATFEYAQVRSKDRSAGTLTFYDKIRYNYRSTLPPFELVGTPFAPGLVEGPATVLKLNQLFNQEIELRGFSLNGITEEDFTGVLSCRLIDCTIDGWAFKSGPTTSSIKRFSYVSCRVRNAVMELDKNIDYIEYIGTDFDWSATLTCSSPSVNLLVFDRCRMAGGLSGSPRNIVIRDTLMSDNWAIGPVYGVTERALLQNSNIQQISSSNQEGQALSVGVSGYTFSNGTLKVAPGTALPLGGAWNNPSAHLPSPCPITWGVPGGKVIIYSPCLANGGLGANLLPTVFGGQAISPMIAFTVTDVYADGAGNYCVDTDLAALPTSNVTFTGTMSGSNLTVNAGSISPADAVLLKNMTVVATAGGTLPAGTVINTGIGVPNATTDQNGVYALSNAPVSGTPTSFTASSPMTYLPHPCPRMTVVNCTGSGFITDQVGAPADIPMFSYFKRKFKLGSVAPQASYPEAYVTLFGNLDSWTINVTKAYTGTTNPFTAVIYFFGWKFSGTNLYPTYVKLTLDLRTAGLRTITSTGSTLIGDTFVDCTGSAVTDITFWLAGGHLITFPQSTGGATLAQMPEFVMVGKSDQGIGTATVISSTDGVAGNTDLLADTVMGAIL